MSFDWMIAKPSTEESFETEKMVRSILSTDDVTELQGLCVSLTRQNRMTTLLLQQAVGRIAQIDARAARRLNAQAVGLTAQQFGVVIEVPAKRAKNSPSRISPFCPALERLGVQACHQTECRR